MSILPDWVVQALQVATVLVFRPLVSGLIAREVLAAEALVRRSRVPILVTERD